MSMLRPGLELTEVVHNASLEERTLTTKPQNNYLDGKRRSGGGRAVDRCMNLKSTGFGPSKVNMDTDMPKLSANERAVITHLDQCGVVHMDTLACGINLSFEMTAKTVAKLSRDGVVCEVSHHGGGFTLLAEGRRIASLLPSVPSVPIKPVAKKKRKRA